MTTLTRAVDLKIAFLQDAAKSMAQASPSTASYLASESIALELAKGSENKATDDHRQTFCTACGNLFIPGWSCSVLRGGRDSVRDRSENGKRHQIVYLCQACHYRTTFGLPQSKKTLRLATQKTSGLPNTPLHLGTKRQTTSDPAIVPMRPSSKKRARARKEKAGLRSLLQKSKEEGKPSPSLSLMDLMMP